MLRKARITKEDLIKHSYTPGCPGCIAAQGDLSRQFRRHTDECRRRMTELLPAMRQKLATDRSNQWISEQVEKSDATMEDTRAPLQVASATAFGSGPTNSVEPVIYYTATGGARQKRWLCLLRCLLLCLLLCLSPFVALLVALLVVWPVALLLVALSVTLHVALLVAFLFVCMVRC